MAAKKEPDSVIIIKMFEGNPSVVIKNFEKLNTRLIGHGAEAATREWQRLRTRAVHDRRVIEGKGKVNA
jgi:hypothetical protein